MKVRKIFNEINKERNTLREAVRFICTSGTEEAKKIRKFFNWDEAVNKEAVNSKCELVKSMFVYSGIGFIWEKIETQDQIVLTKQSIGIIPLRRVKSKSGDVSYKVEYNNYNAIRLIMEKHYNDLEIKALFDELDAVKNDPKLTEKERDSKIEAICKDIDKKTIEAFNSEDLFQVDKKR